MRPPALDLELPITGPRFALEPGDGPATLTIRRCSDSAVVGHIEVVERRGVPHVQSLAVDAAYRGYGAGSEAARLLTDALLAHRPRITAWAPPHLGLSVYFWSRMGFRPVHGQGPDGGLLFERSNASAPEVPYSS